MARTYVHCRYERLVRLLDPDASGNLCVEVELILLYRGGGSLIPAYGDDVVVDGSTAVGEFKIRHIHRT